jgi:hypothetical protein
MPCRRGTRNSGVRHLKFYRHRLALQRHCNHSQSTTCLGWRQLRRDDGQFGIPANHRPTARPVRSDGAGNKQECCRQFFKPEQCHHFVVQTRHLLAPADKLERPAAYRR